MTDRAGTRIPWRPLGETGVHYWLVQRMAKRCGVDTAEAAEHGMIDQEDWAGMVAACRGCDCPEDCERLLDRISEAPAGTPPDYCRNAGILRLLARTEDDA